MGSGNIRRKQAVPIRNEAMQKQGGLCKYCFDPINNNSATLDHVDPVARRLRSGLPPNAGNSYVACCEPCNAAKADAALHEFVAVIASEAKPSCPRIAEAWWRRHRNLRLLEAALQQECAA